EWHLQFAVHFLVLFLVRMLRKPARERVDEGEVAVHVFIFDKRPTHDDLRNQDQRHDVGGRLRIRNEGGNHQAEGDPTHRCHEHDPEVNPKHPPDFENVIADQDKEDALRQREDAERNRFRENIVRQPDIEIALPLQNHPIANDIVGAVGQAEEHRDDKCKKEKRRDVIGGGKIVGAAVGVAQQTRDQKGQHRRDPDSDDEIAAIAQLADEGALQQGAQLCPFVVPAKRYPFFLLHRRAWQRRHWLLAQGYLLNILDQAEGFIFVPPEFRRVTPRRHQLTAIVLLVNNVVTEIAQRRFQNVENKFRPGRSARWTCTQI